MTKVYDYKTLQADMDLVAQYSGKEIRQYTYDRKRKAYVENPLIQAIKDADARLKDASASGLISAEITGSVT